ncbi:condensation domain-containing protein [Streptomyces cyaneofuscatus]|uniref:condensation domain-containing protein n=1 Tax=Streptomyces cyaneofuscatus TaxID=66883 RepID=UPI0037BD87C0
MNQEKTAPMTFGQLSVIRDLDLSGPDEQSDGNLPLVLPLPPGTSKETAVAAWARLVERHEALRTVYDRRTAQPTQTVRPFEPFELGTVQLADATEEAALSAAADWAKQEIHIDCEHSWRAAVGVHEGAAMHLVCVVHHLAADSAACALLEREFATLVAGGTLHSDPPQPWELALEQHGDADQREQTMEYWLEEWQGFVDDDRQGGDTSRRVRVALYSERAMTAAHRVAERLSVSVQSVIFGASSLVLCHLKGRERATFGLLAGNRAEKRWQSLLSSMNQLAPITVEAPRESSPDAFLRALYLRSLERLLYGAYSIDELRRRLTETDHVNPDPLQFDCYFNFLGDIAEPPPAGSPALDDVEWFDDAWQGGPSFNLRASMGTGLYLSLTASDAYLGTEAVGRFLAATEAALVSLADGAPDTLAEVSLAPLRQVSLPRGPGPRTVGHE